MSSLAKPVNPAAVAPQLAQTPETKVPWGLIAWFAGLLVLCYASVIGGLIDQWNNNEDMGHGFFVPAIAAWISWQKRDEVLAAPRVTNWWGLALVVFAGL